MADCYSTLPTAQIRAPWGTKAAAAVGIAGRPLKGRSTLITNQVNWHMSIMQRIVCKVKGQ